MPRQTMLLGTDGNSQQLTGLQLFFHSLNKNSPVTLDEWEITIAYPAYVSFDQASFAELAPKVHFLSFPVERHPDKYYVKLLLKVFAETAADPNDLIIYLDYDHIVRSSVSLPPVHDGDLYVGSEVKLLSDVVDRSTFGEEDERTLFHTHYNASLIYGSIRTLRMAVHSWANVYEECIGRVAPRYVEEIAFSLSAFRSGCRLIPISTKIQCGWDQGSPDSALFHYGGEHYMANTIKQLFTKLSKEAADRTRVNPDQLAFGVELLGLLAELKSGFKSE
jgi:hypothetical protein